MVGFHVPFQILVGGETEFGAVAFGDVAYEGSLVSVDVLISD